MDDVQQVDSWELAGLSAGVVLEFDADAYGITVEPVAPGQTPRLELARKGDGAPPRVTVGAVEHGVLRVRAEHARGGDLANAFGLLDWFRDARLVLRVPADVRARVRTAAGNLRARDLNGCELELSTEAGTIVARAITGAIRLSTGAGTIDGDELAGAIDAQTAAGTIKLDVVGLAPGHHRVQTEAGTVRIDLAEGLDVRVEAQTAIGNSRVDYPSVRDAAATLDVRTGAGTIRVRPTPRARTAAYTGGPVVVTDAPNEMATASHPYRRATVPTAAPTPTRDTGAELERVLEMVAQGKLSPTDARELLRALGHG